MVAPLDLQRELPKEKLVRFTPLPGAVKFTGRTPLHQFATYILPWDDGNWFAAFSCRDSIDDDLAALVLRFVDGRKRLFEESTPLTILDGFHAPGYGFDCVAVLSPTAANHFRAQSAALSKRTFVVFPIFRCEFVGDETVDCIWVMRHDTVTTVDMKRSPSPAFTMYFENKKIGIKSTQQEPALTRLGFLIRQLEQMDGADGSLVDLQNYRNEKCSLLVDEGKFKVSTERHPENAMHLSLAETRDWLLHFLCGENYADAKAAEAREEKTAARKKVNND